MKPSPRIFLTKIALSIFGGFALLASSISLASEPAPDPQFDDPATVILLAAKDEREKKNKRNKKNKADKEGVQCKRVRKTGSNRIQRVCTTRKQREKANEESTAWLHEQQREQERIEAASQDTGSVSPN